MPKTYDIIIIGAGAAGFFTSINAPKNASKLILEKNKNPGVKVLLSGGERANVSNMDIEPTRDYFGQNTKALIGMFKKYNQYDIMSFFAENGVNIIEEDRGRLILESGDSRELLDVLLRKSRENNTTLKCDSSVTSIEKNGEDFKITTISGEIYFSKKVVITSGGTSFGQVGTTGDGYIWAKNFGHTIINPHRGLCGLVTKKDFSEISGVSSNLQMILYDKNFKKPIYEENGPLLFTHFGISGPIIFNAAVSLGNHLNTIKLDEFKSSLDFSKVPNNEYDDFLTREYLKHNIYLNLIFDIENTPKSILKFLNLDTEKNYENDLFLQDFRTWKEAKVTTGGVKIDELTNALESKLVPNLFFAGEILDITGKTGGFNLQQAWTTGYIVGKSL